MVSLLTVVEAAGDLGLLSLPELRAAAGISDTSQDGPLAALGLRCSASIASECNVAAAAGFVPTLKQETLTETIWQVRGQYLTLSRRHDVVISSLVEDGATLAASDYLANPESGLVTRLRGDCPACWSAAKVVVTYKAGFSAIPGDLKQAAMDFVAFAYRESQRDPALKSIEVDIPDVERTSKTYWVGSVPGQTSEGAVPDIVAGQLRRYRNYVIG